MPLITLLPFDEGANQANLDIASQAKRNASASDDKALQAESGERGFAGQDSRRR